MNRSRLLFIHIQALPLSVHRKWKEIVDGKIRWEIIQEQLLMTNSIELWDNSIDKRRKSGKRSLNNWTRTYYAFDK